MGAESGQAGEHGRAVTVWDRGVHMDISGLLLLHPSADTSSLVQPIPSYPPGEPLWGPSASDTLSAHSSWHTLGLFWLP